MTQTPNPPPGWYPEGGQERWWNGSSWSDSYRPLSAVPFPPQQPQQPQQPAYYQPGAYQPGAYQPGVYQPPQQDSHTLRNVLIVIGVLVVLLVGGCTALVAVVGNRIDNAVNDDTPGGPNNPLTITEGKAFEVAGFDYQDGWSIGPDEVGDADVTGLKLTNNRGESDYLFTTIKLLDANEVVASIECTGPDGSQISDGTTVTLECSGFDDMPATWDKVTIQDAF